MKAVITKLYGLSCDLSGNKVCGNLLTGVLLCTMHLKMANFKFLASTYNIFLKAQFHLELSHLQFTFHASPFLGFQCSLELACHVAVAVGYSDAVRMGTR